MTEQKKSPSQRSKEIERAMKLAWSSLESHLPYTYGRSSEGTKFHIKCVKEYVQIIENLSNLY
jgi:hypothetical protein